MLTEKRTSTSIPINNDCHNKNQCLVREQKVHFVKQKQIDCKEFVYKLNKNFRDIRTNSNQCIQKNSSNVFYMLNKIILKNLDLAKVDRIIEMAWEDRTPFDAIYFQFNLREKQVIQLMRSNLKTSSFKMWRKRVT